MWSLVLFSSLFVSPPILSSYSLLPFSFFFHFARVGKEDLGSTEGFQPSHKEIPATLPLAFLARSTPPDGFRILSDTQILRSSQILPDSPRFSQIFPGPPCLPASFRSSQIFPDYPRSSLVPPRSSQVLSDSQIFQIFLRSSQVLPDILSDLLRSRSSQIYQLLPDPSQILPDPPRSSQILPDILSDLLRSRSFLIFLRSSQI